MRVVTGSARGMRLQTLEGLQTRPTSDRVKEALFNILQFEIEGRRVLDMFAGSGQLGIEALSRGAAYAVFIDKNPQAVQVIKDNLRHTGLFANTQVQCQDSIGFVSRTADAFDVVIIDPPYASGVYETALAAVAPRVRQGGVVTCECDAKAQLPESVDTLVLERTYRYGKTAIWLYRSKKDDVK